MLFCSWNFAQFFTIVFALYWFVPWRRLRWKIPLPRRRSFTLTGDEARIWLLLAASFYFYASWSRKLALLIVASTLLDYCIGLGLETFRRPRLRLALLVLSITANLGLLCLFKYSNFFLASLDEVLIAAGSSRWFNTLQVILPIGISFYTFEAINYTVDVYRRQVRAERNPAHLLFFVLFFPHLIAGPIVRAKDFLPQIRRSKRWSWARFQLGGEYFLLGLLKKWIFADQLALYADPVFAAPGDFGTLANWLALLAFTLQVYCDISGYSDMALGTAHLLGYKLSMNFNMPYLATSVADYWRRDHISLSTWLRDYLFIPLGGSRGSRWQVCRNFLITMTLGGLWHGASWNFVLWGFLHGVFLSVNRFFRVYCQARPSLESFLQSMLGTALRMTLTFFCVYQGFVLFRAQTFALTQAMYHRLWVPVEGVGVAHPYGYGLFWCLVAVFVLAHVAACRQWWERFSLRLPTPILGFTYVLALILCMVMAPIYDKPFLYMQF
ncbi:MAG TPA: MBOAT family O-acyltransferase [Gemmataceae bacterium]|nr:MBOAT family O-acyltransferase [Gemmataceae bacterium]